jgi:hypothetical protein
MGDLDTDSAMMRRQQGQDVSETLAEDETSGKASPTDLDPESRAAREASKAGEAVYANEQMDAIFNSNKRAGAGQAETDMMEDRATDGAASLVRPDRSILGS